MVQLIRRHWFRNGLAPNRRQAIIQSNVDQILQSRMVLIYHNELHNFALWTKIESPNLKNSRPELLASNPPTGITIAKRNCIKNGVRKQLKHAYKISFPQNEVKIHSFKHPPLLEKFSTRQLFTSWVICVVYLWMCSMWAKLHSEQSTLINVMQLW